MYSSIVLSTIGFHIEDFVVYLLGNGLRVGFYLVVGKSYDLEACIVQGLRPLGVGDLLAAFTMITTVYLDDKTILETNKVGNELSDGMLSAKPDAIPVLADFLSQQLFSESLVSPVFKSEGLEHTIVYSISRFIAMRALVVFQLCGVFMLRQ